MRHIISALVENRFGVLTRIAGLFSARGYNIDSLAVGTTEDPAISRMTIVVNAEDERILEQIKKQLNKLIDVISVTDITKKEYIERDLMFIKVACNTKSKAKIKKIANKFKVTINASKKDYLILEATLSQEDEKKFLNSLADFQIKELVRTGRIAMVK